MIPNNFDELLHFVETEIRKQNTLLLEAIPTKIKLSVAISSRPRAFLVKGVLKICSKFIGQHPYQSVISIKLLRNFGMMFGMVFAKSHFSRGLLRIFRTPFSCNTSQWLLLCNYNVFSQW